jgi:hypothetical protein
MVFPPKGLNVHGGDRVLDALVLQMLRARPLGDENGASFDLPVL